ncbi:subtilisin-like protease SBT3.13, partial [Triticum dicoccoides]
MAKGFFSSSSSRAHHRVAWVLLCLCMMLCRVHGGSSSRKVYIVYLGDVKHGHPDHVVASHHDMLTTLLGSKEESMASVVYNYKHGFSGFAAMLTPEQAERLAEFPEVISVEPSRRHKASTTRSWDFLG